MEIPDTVALDPAFDKIALVIKVDVRYLLGVAEHLSAAGHGHIIGDRHSQAIAPRDTLMLG